MLLGRVAPSRFSNPSLAQMQALVADGLSRPYHATDPATATIATEEAHMATRYALAFDPRFAGPLRLLGIHPARAYVQVTDRHLEARFGPWRVVTSIANIEGSSITGPHHPRRAIGPRFSPSTRSLTFGSNATRTVRIAFRRPVPGMEPFGIVKHPSLSVSVADPEKLRDHLDTLTSEG